MSFPRNTGVGADNIAPRAVSRLSEASRSCLASIIMGFERLGDWCRTLHMVVISLLPKCTGGLRPIGLLPLEVRIWARARNDVVRGWEAAHALPCLFGGHGMGAHRAAWLAAFKAEAAAMGNEQYVQAMLDLTKAFEAVPHDALINAARDMGYNARLLRLTRRVPPGEDHQSRRGAFPEAGGYQGHSGWLGFRHLGAQATADTVDQRPPKQVGRRSARDPLL